MLRARKAVAEPNNPQDGVPELERQKRAGGPSRSTAAPYAIVFLLVIGAVVYGVRAHASARAHASTAQSYVDAGDCFRNTSRVALRYPALAQHLQELQYGECTAAQVVMDVHGGSQVWPRSFVSVV